MELMKLFGVLGLLAITAGVLMRGRKRQDYAFIAGGVLLEIYSIYIGDVVFMVLQVIFIAAAAYNLLQVGRRNGKK